MKKTLHPILIVVLTILANWLGENIQQIRVPKGGNGDFGV